MLLDQPNLRRISSYDECEKLELADKEMDSNLFLTMPIEYFDNDLKVKQLEDIPANGFDAGISSNYIEIHLSFKREETAAAFTKYMVDYYCGHYLTATLLPGEASKLYIESITLDSNENMVIINGMCSVTWCGIDVLVLLIDAVSFDKNPTNGFDALAYVSFIFDDHYVDYTDDGKLVIGNNRRKVEEQCKFILDVPVSEVTSLVTALKHSRKQE